MERFLRLYAAAMGTVAVGMLTWVVARWPESREPLVTQLENVSMEITTSTKVARWKSGGLEIEVIVPHQGSWTPAQHAAAFKAEVDATLALFPRDDAETGGG